MTRRGIALPIVMMLTMVLMTLVASLFFRVDSQKITLPKNHDQTKALFVAKGLQQLALYKAKVLPADFYKADLLRRVSGSSDLFDYWMTDFDIKNPQSIAVKILSQFPDVDKSAFSCGISTFTIRMKESGYKTDLVLLGVWGKYRDQTRALETFVEYDIKVD